MKNIFRVIFILLILIITWFATKSMQPIETELFSAFMTSDLKTMPEVKAITALTGNQLNIVLENNNEKQAEILKDKVQDFITDEVRKREDVKSVFKIYKEHPNNFLNFTMREKLKNKNYKEIETISRTLMEKEKGEYVVPLNKDPFLLATSYVFDEEKMLPATGIEYEGKIYNLYRHTVNSKQEMDNVIQFREDLKKEGIQGKIYLTGSPIRTYITREAARSEINFICLISIFAFIILCMYHFKTPEILLPVFGSILFGMFIGWAVATLVFHKLHILTFVFSTSLIGISIDYSLHYYLSSKDKFFKKSLVTSLLSSLFAFLPFYFSNIEVLKQISVFAIAGLIGVFLFVYFFLSLYDIEVEETDFRPFNVNKYKTPIVITLCTVLALGIFKVHFGITLNEFYNPKKSLVQADRLYTEVFKPNVANFILTDGDTVDEILEKEEEIADNFEKEGVQYLSLSKFISSTSRQKENLRLTKQLYKERLLSYATFLPLEDRREILQNEGKIFEPENFPLNKNFMSDDNTSFMLVVPPFNLTKNLTTLNLKEEISKILKTFRYRVLSLLPIVFVLLHIVLNYFYSVEKTKKIIMPSFMGGLFAICLISLFGVEINAFHIIGFILVIGFSMDYSIFRTSEGKSANLPVFISCISTVISFALLSFTSFKLMSSLGIVLAIGVFTAYILSLLFIPTDNPPVEKAT